MGFVFFLGLLRTERAAELLLGLLRAPPLHERVDGRSGERDHQDAAADCNADDRALALGRRPVSCNTTVSVRISSDFD
jgi:hypothetical protein